MKVMNLAEARAAAEADIVLWSGVEKEWRTPKGDLTAYFMRQNARSHCEEAEKRLAVIGATEAALAERSHAPANGVREGADTP